VFDLVAQLPHVHAQVVRVLDMGRSPHLAQELAVREHLAGVVHEDGQELVLDRREVDLVGVDGDDPARLIDDEAAHREHRVLVSGAAGGVAQGDAHACEQLVGAEGLLDVVVGSRVQRGDLVALAAAGGEDDHRHRRPLAQPPDHLEPIHVGQPEVDDHDVGLPRRDLHRAVGAGDRFEQAIALRVKGDAEEAADLSFVLDQDDGGISHRSWESGAAFPSAAA
jgi:hypothetical protein